MAMKSLILNQLFSPSDRELLVSSHLSEPFQHYPPRNAEIRTHAQCPQPTETLSGPRPLGPDDYTLFKIEEDR